MPRSVELLIGSGASLSLFSIGQINLSLEEYDLYLQKTRLSWVVAGGSDKRAWSNSKIRHLTKLENQLDKFWAIEEIATDKPNAKKDTECETHFTRNTLRDDSVRYTVCLPFRETSKRLGESRNIALKRLAALERKFEANASLRNEYTRAMKEYIKSNYVSMAKDISDDGYYLPYHAVIKESSNTTKVRIVFNASAKTSTGVSLNDTLIIGPLIQDKLFLHLIRFREHN